MYKYIYFIKIKFKLNLKKKYFTIHSIRIKKFHFTVIIVTLVIEAYTTFNITI